MPRIFALLSSSYPSILICTLSIQSLMLSTSSLVHSVPFVKISTFSPVYFAYLTMSMKSVRVQTSPPVKVTNLPPFLENESRIVNISLVDNSFANFSPEDI